MITGRRVFHKLIDYDPDKTPPEELEGIDIWNILSGQIHVLMLDNDWPSKDDVYLKHFKVSGGDEDKI